MEDKPKYFVARYCQCGHLDYDHFLATGACKPHDAPCDCKKFEDERLQPQGVESSAALVGKRICIVGCVYYPNPHVDPCKQGKIPF